MGRIFTNDSNHCLCCDNSQFVQQLKCGHYICQPCSHYDENICPYCSNNVSGKMIDFKEDLNVEKECNLRKRLKNIFSDNNDIKNDDLLEKIEKVISECMIDKDFRDIKGRIKSIKDDYNEKKGQNSKNILISSNSKNEAIVTHNTKIETSNWEILYWGLLPMSGVHGCESF